MTPITGISILARGAVLALAQVVALPAAIAAAPQAAGTVAQRAAFERAAGDFQRGRFAAAYGQFARLAAHGDTRAAAIALLMYREGRALFRTEWDASPDQQSGWRALAIEANRHEAVQP